MDEKIKTLSWKIVNDISKKIQDRKLSDFHRLGSNVGIGADGTATKYIDKIAEDVAVEILNKSKIKVNLLSEEIGFIDNQAEYTFVLDPIDGTRNACRGIPFYSVSLAVGKSKIDDVEYGIVKNIPTGDVFVSEKGNGTFYNNNQIIIPEMPSKTLLSSLSLGINADKFTLNLAKQDRVRSLGSASLEMCMVAIGGLDYYVVGREYLRVTDIAASTLLLREAGGVVTNIHGEKLDMPFSLDDRTSVIAAANEEIVKKLVS